MSKLQRVFTHPVLQAHYEVCLDWIAEMLQCMLKSKSTHRKLFLLCPWEGSVEDGAECISLSRRFKIPAPAGPSLKRYKGAGGVNNAEKFRPEILKRKLS